MQSIYQLNNQPIFLLGFMGSGKTHWGQQWAQYLNIPFVDLDQLIEADEKMTIANIFEKKGEEYFRKKESEILKALGKNATLVSCGGGTPCFFDNINWMNDNGLTIFLEASPRFLLNNILREPNVRPLTKSMNQAELLFFIETKLQQRSSFYTQAKIILPAEQVNKSSLDKLITINA